MANYLKKSFKNEELEFFDLQENPLPMCDGDECYDLPEVLEFREKVKNAEGIIMAIPVYNFNVSSGAKNIIERKEFEGESKLLEKGIKKNELGRDKFILNINFCSKFSI